MRTIVIGFDEAKRKVEKALNLDNLIMETLSTLMKEAEAVANRAYMYQTAGNYDYHSEVLRVPNGFELRMFGEDVGFLEFGAGVTTQADDFADQVDYPVASGSWSETHGRIFAERGYWMYAGVRYKGLAPRRGMQKALDYLKDNIKDRIEKAIREWID